MNTKVEEIKRELEGIKADISKAKDELKAVREKGGEAPVADEETKQAIGNLIVTVVVTAALALSLVKGFKGKDYR